MGILILRPSDTTASRTVPLRSDAVIAQDHWWGRRMLYFACYFTMKLIQSQFAKYHRRK